MLRCLALAALLVGCRSVGKPVNHETRAQLGSSSFVTLPRLADDLDLDYRGEAAGFIELSAPPDHVMFVRDSRQAIVNGDSLAMNYPCMRRGDDYVLTADDADRVRDRLFEARATRRPDPGPAVAPRTAPAAPAPPPTLSPRLRPDPGARPRHWKFVVIHHAATPRGSAAIFHRMHRQRGWDGLGYHFVIGNGSQTRDGAIEVGYRWRKQVHGAHARARANDDNRWNLHGIGICLVGDFQEAGPSRRQLDALVDLVRALRREYGIPARNVVPHSFVTATQCPGTAFPWDDFHARIR